MESIEQIKARLENIQNIEPILVALRTIALSSWRTALRRLEQANFYYSQLARVHELVSAHFPQHGTLIERKAYRRCALLIVGSQRGLCGPFSSMVMSAAQRALREIQPPGSEPDNPGEPMEIEILVLGERARREARRLGLQTAWEGALPVASVPSLVMAAELAAMGVRRYEAGELDAFYAVYNHYLGGGRYEPRRVTLIPASPPDHPAGGFAWPSPILGTDVRSLHNRVRAQLVELAFYRILLESTVAEQSARFQLMEGASQNSRRLIEELTLTYHTARQEAITEEMLELAVSAGLVGWE